MKGTAGLLCGANHEGMWGLKMYVGKEEEVDSSREEWGGYLKQRMDCKSGIYKIYLVSEILKRKTSYYFSLWKLIDPVLPVRHGLPWLMSFQAQGHQ